MSLEETLNADPEPVRERLQVIADTDHLAPLDASQIENTVQLFANILVNAWTEIVESEDAGKRAFSFTVVIAGRSIDAKLSGSKKFKYDDEIFISDPYQPELPLDEDGQEETPAETLLLNEGSRWWEILGIKQTSGVAEIEKAFIRKVKKLHPDTCEGDGDKMGALNLAREEAIKACYVDTTESTETAPSGADY